MIKKLKYDLCFWKNVLFVNIFFTKICPCRISQLDYLCRMRRVLYFLALFGYLNVLCYEVKYCTILDSMPIAASDTFLEVVFEDVLDLEHNHAKEEFPDIKFDDYRILSVIVGILPAVLFVLWLLRRLYLRNDKVKHSIYYVRRLIQPGYYTFLYRYGLF